MAVSRGSVVIPVKNEEESILQLLRSLEKQTLKPSEVIIVDGGSSDDTVDIIKSFMKSRSNYKLLVAEGANIARSRNIGIAAASSDVIACTDAGVVLDRCWLENLEKYFDAEGADFVSGVSVGCGESLLQRGIIALQYPKIDKLSKEDFLPSSRSVAFRKSVWKAVGGYPEDLEKAEDTFFDLRVKEMGCKIALARDAKAYWPPRDSLRKLFRQYSSYAEWDVKAGLLFKLKVYRHLFLAYFIVLSLSALSLVFGYIWFLILVFLACVYLMTSSVVLFKKTRNLLSFLVGPTIKIVIFMAETFGLLKGFVELIGR